MFELLKLLTKERIEQCHSNILDKSWLYYIHNGKNKTLILAKNQILAYLLPP